MEVISLQKVLDTDVLEIRGDGKAGGGLVLAMQSFAALCIRNKSLHVQEWPFFSSARRGAAVRSFIRVSRREIKISCEVANPHISVLMDSGAAKFVDFAQGVRLGGTFIMNTIHTPEEVAKHYHLSGRVMSIDGDHLGQKHLKSPRGNISVYAALVRAVGSLDVGEARQSLQEVLAKRRLPKAVQEANLTLFDASLEACRTGVYDLRGPDEHRLVGFEGYGVLPPGAQTALRISIGNKTANYARSGARVAFQDPHQKCNGCTYCIINCPENIIQFVPDAERGVLVTGAHFDTYCKYCRECVEVCPEKLFVEQPYQEVWES